MLSIISYHEKKLTNVFNNNKNLKKIMMINNIYRSQQLISAGEDGLVLLWDERMGKPRGRLEPHTNSKVSRPDIGKWMGAASLGDDWIVSLCYEEVPL